MKLLRKISIFCICMILGVSCMALVGCGEDKDTIRLNEVTRSIFYAPLYVAYNLGYFKDEGLKVTIETNKGSDGSMAVLLSGNCDVALIGPEQVVYAKETSDRPMVFGQLTQCDGSFIVSKTQIEDFNLDMLKNKSIIGGRRGGLPAMTLQYIIEEAGLTIGTGVDEVNLDKDTDFANIGSKFISENADFCTLFEPTATALAAEYPTRAFVVSNVGKFAQDVPYTCFVSKQSYLKKNPDKISKFLKAVKRGYEYLLTQSHSDSAKALEKSFVGTSLSDLEIAVQQYITIEAWSSDLILKESSFEKLVDIINNANEDEYSPEFSMLVDNSFAEALKAA